MPTYEYHCDNCAENFDVVQSFTDDPLTECPTCGSPVREGVRQRGHRVQGQRLLQDRQPFRHRNRVGAQRVVLDSDFGRFRLWKGHRA